MTDYERAHKNALQVQDACNFSGVLLSFARDMEAVRAHLHETGTYSTPALAFHPVAILYMSKLYDLQHYHQDDAYGKAYDACQAVVAAIVTDPAVA